jgi:hypothetical protein
MTTIVWDGRYLVADRQGTARIINCDEPTFCKKCDAPQNERYVLTTKIAFLADKGYTVKNQNILAIGWSGRADLYEHIQPLLKTGRDFWEELQYCHELEVPFTQKASGKLLLVLETDCLIFEFRGGGSGVACNTCYKDVTLSIGSGSGIVYGYDALAKMSAIDLVSIASHGDDRTGKGLSVIDFESDPTKIVEMDILSKEEIQNKWFKKSAKPTHLPKEKPSTSSI